MKRRDFIKHVALAAPLMPLIGQIGKSEGESRFPPRRQKYSAWVEHVSHPEYSWGRVTAFQEPGCIYIYARFVEGDIEITQQWETLYSWHQRAAAKKIICEEWNVRRSAEGLYAAGDADHYASVRDYVPTIYFYGLETKLCSITYNNLKGNGLTINEGSNKS